MIYLSLSFLCLSLSLYLALCPCLSASCSIQVSLPRNVPQSVYLWLSTSCYICVCLSLSPYLVLYPCLSVLVSLPRARAVSMPGCHILPASSVFLSDLYFLLYLCRSISRRDPVSHLMLYPCLSVLSTSCCIPVSLPHAVSLSVYILASIYLLQSSIPCSSTTWILFVPSTLIPHRNPNLPGGSAHIRMQPH